MGKKASVEALLAALTTYAEKRVDPKSSLGFASKTIMMDAAPEISHRLLSTAREELHEVQAAGPYSPEKKSVALKVLNLQDEDLLRLLLYLERANEDECSRFLDFASSSPPEELSRFSSLSDEERATLLKLHMAQGKAHRAGGKIKEALQDTRTIFSTWASKSRDLGAELIHRYVLHLVWTLKSIGVLLAGALVASTAASGSEEGWSLPILLVLAAAGFACAGEWGRRGGRSWLKASGYFTAGAFVFLALLAPTADNESVLAVAMTLLVVLPVLILIMLCLPLTMVLEILRGISPAAHASLIRAFQMMFSVFLGLMLFTGWVVLFPPAGPVGYILLMPVVIGVALAAGVGLTRVSSDRYVRPPVIAAVSLMMLVAVFLLGMPNVRNRIQSIPVLIDRSIGGDLVQIRPSESEEVLFVTEAGKPMIWYATREGGGYDLYTSSGTGPFYAKDGRKLALAESPEIRRDISEWLDQEAARREAVRLSEERKRREQARQEEARRAARAREEEMERIAREKEAEARRAILARAAEAERRASYLLMDELPEQVSYLVQAVGPNQKMLNEIQLQVVELLRERGASAETGIFSSEFVKSGAFDLFYNGKAETDLQQMPLGEMGERLMLVKCPVFRTELSQRVAGLHRAVIEMSIHLVDAKDGRILERYHFEAVGPGASEAIALDAASQRIRTEMSEIEW